MLHRARSGLCSSHAARGEKGESGAVSVFLAMESSGVDEGRGLDAGRIHAAALLRPERTVLLAISAKLCGGRGGDPGGDGAERSLHPPRRPQARLSMAAVIRTRVPQ